ncbi:MAG TPA: hypothetical protein VH370_02370 [Humisphaera sp.]|jgi:hypothetical protein|nr:hypothetical protein [Humisphaera sp.]
MLKWIGALDRILKGEVTRLSALRSGTIDVPAGGLSVVVLMLGIIYGVCMGVFAVVGRWKTPHVRMGFEQLAASAVKVPSLFFLTLLITFPSLYVFNALVGSRLSFKTVLRLLIAVLGVMLAVLASFGTIIVFFSVCTTSYPFMLVLNVIMFSISGLLGLGFLLQTLHRLSMAQELNLRPQPISAPPAPVVTVPSAPAVAGPAEKSAADPAAPQAPPAAAPSNPAPLPLPNPRPSGGALDWLDDQAVSRNVRLVFRLWLILFAIVGAQMGWVLRPFIGNPALPFTLFRPRQSNFFEAVYRALHHLFS